MSDLKLKWESEVFDKLATKSVTEVAAESGVTVPTVYAIDKREAERRGVPRNLAGKSA